MKVKCDTPILQLDGHPMKDAATGGDINFRMVAHASILNRMASDPPDAGKTAALVYQLAHKLMEAEPDLTAEDVVFLKRRVVEVQQSYLIVGRMLDILEPKH